MNIIQSKPEHLSTLKSWFPDKLSSYYWGGPSVAYPFTDETFMVDINWGGMPTYSLVNDKKELIGFGQYFEKVGRCHLARLAISPLHRSKGYGSRFILSLMKIGMKDLKVSECSLFVSNSNKRALKCYRALGFKKAAYPPQHKFLSDIDFMVCQKA